MSCVVDDKVYETGKKIIEEEKNNLDITYEGPNEKWNYVIRPNAQIINKWKTPGFAGGLTKFDFS